MLDKLSVLEIEKYLKDKGKFNISVLGTVTSTNALLKQEAQECGEGRVIIADSQTKGSGRFQRKFHSPIGCGIYMSILIKPDFTAETSVLITAAAALAVAEAVENLSGKKTQIKWVNDVLIEGKKVCGILTEGIINPKTGKIESGIVGIGINVYEPEEGYPEEIFNIAGAVFGERQENKRNKLTALVINRFWDYYTSLDKKTFLGGYKSRMASIGKEIDVIRGDSIKKAEAVGIDNSCRLKVRYPNGETEYLSSGEISIKTNTFKV